MTPAHPDLPAEQAYIDHAVECLERTQEKAKHLAESAPSGGSDRFAARKLREIGEAYLRKTNEAEDRVCFARIDRDAGTPLYLGVMSIQDAAPGAKNPVVINWEAPAAEPFYKATPDDRRGLVRKRRFTLDDTTLTGIADEPLVATLPQGIALSPEVPAPAPATGDSVDDAILRELERERSSEMRDIVPTIKRDQYELITMAPRGTLVIQGGPGTGKTAVALHRAAWLTFNHGTQLQGGAGVLVVGPNPAFMQYIASVLPGLGRGAVVQAAVDRLPLEPRTTRTDPPDLARLKGSPVMAEVISSYAQQRVRAPVGSFDFEIGALSLSIPASVVENAIKSAWGAAETRRPYMQARERFRAHVRQLARDAYIEATSPVGRRREFDDQQLTQQLNRTTGPWFNSLERVWPTMSGPQLIHDLLTVEQRLESASDGRLTKEQRDALMRAEVTLVRKQPWTTSDVALVDEAEAVLNGPGSASTYGYVVVDEAQDLTPMQLRMVGRRARGGNVTLVGDIAQATGSWTYRTWQEIVGHLPFEAEDTYRELTIGYRVPRPIMNYASVLLERIAAGLKPVDARRAGIEPSVELVSGADLADAAALEAAVLAEGERTVGVIVPGSLAKEIRAGLQQLEADVGDLETDGLQRQITLLPSASAKGLEFDHVVVVEPRDIVREGIHGYAELYVALTRATQRLAVVHAQPLPAPLPGGTELDDDKLEARHVPPVTSASTGADVDAAVQAAPSAPDGRLTRAVHRPVPHRRRSEPVELSGEFTEALIFSKLQHSAQAQRGSDVPYLAHLLNTCGLVLQDGGTEAEAIAALLHDVAEDHGGLPAIRRIERRFGGEIAGIVALCTDLQDPEKSWRENKADHLDRVETSSPSVRRVALAEKLDNSRTTVARLRERGSALWGQMKVDPDDLLWYFDAAAATFERAQPGSMAIELRRTVDELHDLAREFPTFTGAAYIQTWRLDTARAVRSGELLQIVSSSQFAARGLLGGDRVYVTFVNDGVLHLIGRIEAASREELGLGGEPHCGWVVPAEAEELMRREVWDADCHVIAREGTAMPMDLARLVDHDLVTRLRFTSRGAHNGERSSVQLDEHGAVNPGSLQAVRRLAPESVPLLDDLL